MIILMGRSKIKCCSEPEKAKQLKHLSCMEGCYWMLKTAKRYMALHLYLLSKECLKHFHTNDYIPNQSVNFIINLTGKSDQIL